MNKIFLTIGLAFLISSCASQRRKVVVVRSFNNMSRISMALVKYAKEHQGNYPDSLDKIKSEFSNADNIMICPVSGKKYRYLGAGKSYMSEADITTMILLDSKLKDSVLNLYMDGHVEEVK